MLDRVSIRPERPGDEAGIRNVLLSAFRTNAEARLVEQLRRDGDLTISLVGLIETEIVGYVAVSPVTVGRVRTGFALGPVAVLPEFQRRGIGTIVVRGALHACQVSDACFVVVLGDPNYYQRFEFLPAARWKLTNPFGGGEAFQLIEVFPGQIPADGGQIEYAPAFSIFANG